MLQSAPESAPADEQPTTADPDEKHSPHEPISLHQRHKETIAVSCSEHPKGTQANRETVAETEEGSQNTKPDHVTREFMKNIYNFLPSMKHVETVSIRARLFSGVTMEQSLVFCCSTIVIVIILYALQS